jgi:hypothetical protein
MKRNRRRGTTTVELAVVLPIFLLILFSLFEFGHAFMTMELLKAAARTAARTGVTDGKTSADVQDAVHSMLAGGIDPNKVVIYIKDGGAFDDQSMDAETIQGLDYDELPDVEVSGMDPRELFIVRLEVPYSDVSIFPTGGWLSGITLSGQAVMRHE